MSLIKTARNRPCVVVMDSGTSDAMCFPTGPFPPASRLAAFSNHMQVPRH